MSVSTPVMFSRPTRTPTSTSSLVAADLRRHLILINNDQAISFFRQRRRPFSHALVASMLLMTALSIFPMPIESTPTQTLVPIQEAKERAAKLVAQMTLDEKLGLVAGVAGIQYVLQMPPAPPEARGGDGFVSGIARLGIPNLQLIGAGLGITDMTGKAELSRL